MTKGIVHLKLYFFYSGFTLMQSQMCETFCRLFIVFSIQTHLFMSGLGYFNDAVLDVFAFNSLILGHIYACKVYM